MRRTGLCVPFLRVPMSLLRFLLLPILVSTGLNCETAPESRVASADVLVTPSLGEKPHRVSAAPLPADEALFDRAVRKSGLGLRGAGREGELVLRYATLDETAVGTFLAELGVEPQSFCPLTSFGERDSVEISALRRSSPVTGFTLHLEFRPLGPGRLALEAAAVARPPDGSLLPVIRGTVPIEGSGPLVLAGEARGRLVFAAILRLELSGTGRTGGVARPLHHRMRAKTFEIGTKDLISALDDRGIPERGSEAGLAAYPISLAQFPVLVGTLERAGSAGPDVVGRFESGEEQIFVLGGLNLAIRPLFRYDDFSYRIRIEARNRPGSPGIELSRQEGRPVLLVGWDADGPGRSRVALVRYDPEDQ